MMSILVPKFFTELNKNVDLYDEISYFAKKSKCRRWYKFNKTQDKKFRSNLKKTFKKNPSYFSLPKKVVAR